MVLMGRPKYLKNFYCHFVSHKSHVNWLSAQQGIVYLRRQMKKPLPSLG
jgi:hypothetical protein